MSVATTIVWQICGDMVMADIEVPGTVYYVWLKSSILLPPLKLEWLV